MAYADIYRRDRLFLPQQKLLAFARDVPTPFYLYNEDGIRKTARLILGSFRWNAGHRAWFPVSVNSCPAILRIYREEGFGALAGSVQELELAQKVGFSDILFHTAAMTPQAVEAVRRSGCGVILDAPGQLAQFGSEPPARCLLRYHPEKELRKAFTSAISRRGKSGMSREHVIETAQALSRLGVREIGLHCHISGGALGEEDYSFLASILLELAEELSESGVRITAIDPGGGLADGTEPGRPTIHMSAVGAQMRRVFAELPEGLQPALYTEFGRFAIARHGILISRVAELRERGRSYAILDLSASQLSRWPNHGVQRISVVGNCARSGRKVYSVHGCTTAARELLCDRAILPPLRVGTLVALHGCGAYCRIDQSRRGLLPSCGSFLFTLGGELVPLSEHE